MTTWYDRQGNALPSQTKEDYQRIEALLTDRSYKRVAQDTLPNGLRVSTVWLGVNYAFNDGPPLIFETMVFLSKDDLSEQDMERYSTEEEALAGHQRMVNKWEVQPASPPP